MMSTSLDKLSSLEAWRTTAEASMDTLVKRAPNTMARINEMAAWIQWLEFRPQLPPPLPPPVQWQFREPPPPLHPPVVEIDLNIVPGASSCAAPLRVDSPMGHGAGGSLLEALPPRNSNNVPTGPALPFHSFDETWHPYPPFPKMDFLKFDRSNPCLWHEQCKLYFDVYVVQEPMKTRFAVLNFKGNAAAWL
jgi:hypothetical protein